MDWTQVSVTDVWRRRSAYLKAVRAVHPDKGGSADDFRVLQHAYQLLMNCATDA